jgi:hypothetical protein
MPESTGFAAILRRDDGRLSITQGDILPAVRRGEVVLVPGALGRLGILEEIVDIILGSVRDTSDAVVADAARARGLERIHDVLDGAQMEATLHQSHARALAPVPTYIGERLRA